MEEYNEPLLFDFRKKNRGGFALDPVDGSCRRGDLFKKNMGLGCFGKKDRRRSVVYPYGLSKGGGAFRIEPIQ